MSKFLRMRIKHLSDSHDQTLAADSKAKSGQVKERAPKVFRLRKQRLLLDSAPADWYFSFDGIQRGLSLKFKSSLADADDAIFGDPGNRVQKLISHLILIQRYDPPRGGTKKAGFWIPASRRGWILINARGDAECGRRLCECVTKYSKELRKTFGRRLLKSPRHLRDLTNFHEFPSKSQTFSFLSEVTKSRRFPRFERSFLEEWLTPSEDRVSKFPSAPSGSSDANWEPDPLDACLVGVDHSNISRNVCAMETRQIREVGSSLRDANTMAKHGSEDPLNRRLNRGPDPLFRSAEADCHSAGLGLISPEARASLRGQGQGLPVKIRCDDGLKAVESALILIGFSEGWGIQAYSTLERRYKSPGFSSGITTNESDQAQSSGSYT
ncbi:hypothetical protein DFH09DRAFT_1484545 [Mycena vulgaris]|nr:hypothetical protein DFH09DRAFT_1484545 [Mycena vulgaris]